MGVKSTTRLSRERAEALYVKLKLSDPEILRGIRAEAVVLSNTELEDVLEEMNDARFREEIGGESGFVNYVIVQDHAGQEECDGTSYLGRPDAGGRSRLPPR